MGQSTKPVSKKRNQELYRFPCDGIKRFMVGRDLCSYSEAYDAIFANTGCETNAVTKARTFSREGMRRIVKLNYAYMNAARLFIGTTMAKMAKDAQEIRNDSAIAVAWGKDEVANPDVSPEVRAFDVAKGLNLAPDQVTEAMARYNARVKARQDQLSVSQQ